MALEERVNAMTPEAALALLAKEISEIQEYLNKSDYVFDVLHDFMTETKERQKNADKYCSEQNIRIIKLEERGD